MHHGRREPCAWSGELQHFSQRCCSHFVHTVARVSQMVLTRQLLADCRKPSDNQRNFLDPLQEIALKFATVESCLSKAGLRVRQVREWDDVCLTISLRIRVASEDLVRVASGAAARPLRRRIEVAKASWRRIHHKLPFDCRYVCCVP